MSVLSEVLGNASAANDNLNAIEDQLFTVVDSPKVAPVAGWAVPEGKEIYRLDADGVGSIHLGSVGNSYESLQPLDFFNAVVDNVRDSGMEFDLGKLTYTTRKDSKIIEFRLPTNIISFKNAAGKTDDTEMFLNFWTGFGGNSRTEVGLYSHRFICTNGLRIINADIDLKVKHTVNMNAKALAFTKELIKLASQVQATSQVWSEMNNVQVNGATKEEFVRKITKMKKDEKYADISTKKKNIVDGLNAAIDVEFGRTGSTVWGLLNGVSYYTNHLAPRSGSEDYVLLASGAKDNELAQKLALELI